MNRRIAGRRLVVILACMVVAVLSGAAAAPGAVVHASFDGVVAESPQGDGGPTMQLNVSDFKLVSRPSGDMIQGREIVLWIGKDGNQDTNCVPAPSIAVQFGPTPVQASVSGLFECTRFDEPPFPLSVDVVWSARVEDLQSATFPWGPGPDDAGTQGGAFAGVQAPATVTGSVTDGTTEFLTAEVTGRIDHVADTQTFRP